MESYCDCYIVDKVTKEEISKIKNELRQLHDQENHLRQEDSKLRKEKVNKIICKDNCYIFSD